MKKSSSSQYKKSAIIAIFASLAVIIVLNVISSYFNAKSDLTQDKRYTLSKSTVNLIKNIDDDLYIKFYLCDENMPVEYEPIVERAKDIMEEFKDLSPKVKFEIINPFDGKNDDEKKSILSEFARKGLTPMSVSKQLRAGEKSSTQYLIPGAVISYKSNERVATLIEEDYRHYYSTEDFSYMRLEYNFMRVIGALVNPHKSQVAFIDGHGELDVWHTAWVTAQMGVKLEDYYHVTRDSIHGRLNSLRKIAIADTAEMTIKDLRNKYDLLVIAQPTQWVSDTDRYIIDQHIMHGGRVLWLLDATNASLDSLERITTFYSEPNLACRSLSSQLFTYGVRINPNLLMDIGSCQVIPMNNGQTFAFPYSVNLTHFTQHPINNKIEQVRANFVSSIDLVGGNDGLKKTVLATTTAQTKVKTIPNWVSLMEGINKPNMEEYSKGEQPVAVLVEGSFKSAFAGLLPLELENEAQFNNRNVSPNTKQIFISDGDMIRNFFSPQQAKFEDYTNMENSLIMSGIYPTGYDIRANWMYDNAEFILNCIDYLCDNNNLIDLRSKVIRIGKLDEKKMNSKKSKTTYAIINIGLPVLLLILLGVTLYLIRKRRYTRRFF